MRDKACSGLAVGADRKRKRKKRDKAHSGLAKEEGGGRGEEG